MHKISENIPNKLVSVLRQGGFGNRGRGPWPGNGPFRHLPPWERPGWVYGRGSCWYGLYPGSTGVLPLSRQGEDQFLQSQKGILEDQLRILQERLSEIENRLAELDGEQDR
jgi:hypothetical protein